MDARIAKQRTALVLDHPFVGALSLRLEVREDPSCDAFWTDGETLGYNPVYASGLSDLEVRGVLAKGCGTSRTDIVGDGGIVIQQDGTRRALLRLRRLFLAQGCVCRPVS